MAQDESGSLAHLARGARLGSRPCALELVARVLDRADEASRAYAELVAPFLDRLLVDDLDGRGHVLVGWAVLRGIGAPKSPERSFALHREAAARGNGDAHFELYCLLSKGEGAPPDEPSALVHLVEAAALGQPRACYSLGAHHARGTGGVTQSWPDAVRWYTRAAELGSPLAAATLAAMYDSGEGVAPDAEHAAYYRKMTSAPP